MDPLWESAGWAGAAAINGAYLAVSMGWLKAGRRFQTANLLGACAFVINGIFHQAWPSVVTNIVWFLISAVSLIRLSLPRQTVAAVVEDTPHFPGLPATTGLLAVVEADAASTPEDVPHAFRTSGT
jgi:hypothetical protein